MTIKDNRVEETKAEEPLKPLDVKPAMVPTIGRKVWYWPSTADIGLEDTAPMAWLDQDQALDATVVLVHTGLEDTPARVTLYIVDHEGTPHSRVDVPLFQDAEAHADWDEGAAGENAYATWMPYQVGQAKKHAGDGK